MEIDIHVRQINRTGGLTQVEFDVYEGELTSVNEFDIESREVISVERFVRGEVIMSDKRVFPGTKSLTELMEIYSDEVKENYPDVISITS